MAGAVQGTYVFGPGLDHPLRMVRGATTHYFHADRLGSIIALSTTAGTVAETYKYDTFGRPSNLSTLGNRFLFTGREYDSETGLYYFRARYQDPRLGRFLSRDPLTWGPDDARMLNSQEFNISFGDQAVSHYAGTHSMRSLLQLSGNASRAMPSVWTQSAHAINLYSYVGNNPTNWIDALGLDKHPPGENPPVPGQGPSPGDGLDGLSRGAGEAFGIAFGGIAAAEALHIGEILISAGTSVIGAGPGGAIAGTILITGGIISIGAGGYIIYVIYNY